MTAHTKLAAAMAHVVSDDCQVPAEFEDERNPGGWSDPADGEGLKRSGTFVTFDLCGQTFAADVSDVREILDTQPVSALPNATGDLLGMIDVRGEGLAVMDLAGRLGMHRKTETRDRRIIVLELGCDAAHALGIVADQVRNVVEIGADQIDAVPEVPGGWDSSALVGIARIEGRLVYLLSLRELLLANLPGPFNFD